MAKCPDEQTSGNEGYSVAADSGLHTTGGVRSRSASTVDSTPSPDPRPNLSGSNNLALLEPTVPPSDHDERQETLPPSHNLQSILISGRRISVEHPAMARYEELVEAVDKEMQRLQRLVSQKESETEQLSEKLEAVTRKKTELEIELTEVKKQLEEESESNRELAAKVSQIEIDKELYKQKLATAEQEKKKAEEANRELREKHKDEVHKLELQISKMETEQGRLRIEMEKTKRERAEFEAALANKTLELNCLQSKAKEEKMQEEIDELKKQLAARHRSQTS